MAWSSLAPLSSAVVAQGIVKVESSRKKVQHPEGGVVNGPHVRFTQKITKTKDGFVVDEDTAITVRRVPLAEYAAFRKDALAADQLMKRTLRIVKKGGA